MLGRRLASLTVVVALAAATSVLWLPSSDDVDGAGAAAAQAAVDLERDTTASMSEPDAFGTGSSYYATATDVRPPTGQADDVTTTQVDDQGSKAPPTTKAPQPAATTSATTPNPPAACKSSNATIVLEGPQSDQYKEKELPANSIIDARSASWIGVDDYPVRLGGGKGGCWIGGNMRGNYPDSDSWDRLHDTAAFSFFMPSFTAIGVRVHNYGDAINITDYSTDFVVSQAHLTYIRDDCVENDRLHSGVVQNSLLDGCYTAFSARPSSSDTTSNGKGNLWTIRNNLVRLQPMPTVYKGSAPGHGGLFKWDKTGRGPNLVLHDNIFRVDQPPNGGNLTTPDGYLVSCSNNVVVWLGEGPYPDPLPDCFTVTTDKSVWDSAVAAWKAKYKRYD